MHESTAPISEDHDVANFLLSLASPSAVHRETLGPRGGGRWRRLRGSRSEKVHECSVCSKRFETGWALGGHMRCHWERDLKGRVVKKKTRKISSMGLRLGVGVEGDLKSSVLTQGENGGKSFGEGESSSPPTLMLPL